MASASLDLRKEDIARRRKQVDALLASVMGGSSPTVQAGAMVVPNYAGAIEKLINAKMHEDQSKSLKADEESYTKDYATALERAVEGYEKHRFGHETTYGKGMTGGLDMEDNVMDPSVKANPRKAALVALMSAMPELKALGASDLAGLQKAEAVKYGEPKPSMTPGGRRMVSYPNMPGYDPLVHQGAIPDEEYTVANDQVVSKTRPGDYRDRFGPPATGAHGGSVFLEQTTGEPKFGPAPPSSSKVVVQGAQFQKRLEGVEVDLLKEGREQAILATNLMTHATSALNKLKTIPAERFGPGANLRNDILKIPEIFGAAPFEHVADMSNLHSKLGNMVLANARTLAPVTKVDTEYLQSIFGSTSDTKLALEQSLQYLIQVNARALNRHNGFVDKLNTKYQDDFNHLKIDWRSLDEVPPPQSQQPQIGKPPGQRKPLTSF